MMLFLEGFLDGMIVGLFMTPVLWWLVGVLTAWWLRHARH